MPLVQIAQLTNLNLNTINKILTLVRIRIFELSVQNQLQSAPLVGQIEVDESYFSARRIKGKRGHGARGKTIAFGLLKRGDKVYTQIVKKCDKDTLHAIIKDKTSIESVINSDGWQGYTQGQASH